MNINIVSPETLRDAQAHPEKYENLQVRVAGWNIPHKPRIFGDMGKSRVVFARVFPKSPKI